MRINIANPILGDDEIEQVTRVIQSGMIASGPETRKFESEFSDYIGCKYSCAVNNGTSALSLSLSALGIGPGDEVITTPMTFVATAIAYLAVEQSPFLQILTQKRIIYAPNRLGTLLLIEQKQSCLFTYMVYRPIWGNLRIFLRSSVLKL